MSSFALFCAKTASAMLKHTGRGGSFPGAVALKLDKDFLSRFQMPSQVILVTGTNGKTTTSNLMAQSLAACGLQVINNHRGDNLNVGIATLLASHADANFRVQADAAVIEVDELTLYRQFEHLHPTVLVITNLFRDQLDRSGEVETVIRKLMEVTENFSGDLILNGDDPNVLRIAVNAKKARVHLFSVGPNAVSSRTTDEASEGKFCPICHSRLVYDYYQYSHIGRFHCPHDDFGRIHPEVYVSSVDYEKGTFVVDGQEYHSFLDAIYAVYNCASVLTLMKVLKLPLNRADEVFRNYQLNEGRNEVFQLSQPCVVNLIKNPTGANETMKFILSEPGRKNVLILLNDNDQDGRDVSWIWDAHFERLNQPEVQKIVCSGTRAYDMALRLKYEGLEERILVMEDPAEAVRWLDEQNLKSYVMATYTALHATRALLRKQEKRDQK